MEAKLTIDLAAQQVLPVYVTEPNGHTIHWAPSVPATPQVEADSFDQLSAKARAEIENRTYHAGEKPTLGRGYDDRLTVRLGLSQNTVYKYLELPVHRGGIRHRRLGKKYHVTERRAIREWEGDPITVN